MHCLSLVVHENGANDITNDEIIEWSSNEAVKTASFSSFGIDFMHYLCYYTKSKYHMNLESIVEKIKASISSEKVEEFDPEKAMNNRKFVEFLNNYDTVPADDEELADRFRRFELVETNSGKIVQILVKDFAQQAGGVRVTSEMRTQVQEIITKWAATCDVTEISDLVESLTKSDVLRQSVEDSRKIIEKSTKDRIKNEAGAELPKERWIGSNTDDEESKKKTHTALFGPIGNFAVARTEGIKQSETIKEAEEKFDTALTELQEKREDLENRFSFFDQMREIAKEAAVAELRDKFGVSDVSEINLEQMKTMSRGKLETAYAYVQKLYEQSGDSEMIKQIMKPLELSLSVRINKDLDDKLRNTTTYNAFSTAIRSVLTTPEFVKIWGDHDPIGKVKTMVQQIAEGNSPNMSTGVRTMARHYLQIIDK